MRVQVEQFVSQGKNSDALSYMSSLEIGAREDFRQLIILLNSRVSRINEDWRNGFITMETANVSRVLISKAILDLLDKMVKEDDSLSSKQFYSKSYFRKRKKSLLGELIRSVEKEEEVEDAMKEVENKLISIFPTIALENLKKDQDDILTQVRIENQFLRRKTRAYVFGKTNAGKTTTINSLFEENILPTSIRLGHTKSLACGSRKNGLIFYDSPGIGDLEKDENMTRASLGLPQLDIGVVDDIRLVDLTTESSEGPSSYQLLSNSELFEELGQESKNKIPEHTLFKSFTIEDFDEWKKGKFEFFIFMITIGGNNGLERSATNFVKEFYKALPSNSNFIKVVNILNDGKKSEYKERVHEYSGALKEAYGQVIERWRDMGLPNPEEWIIIESNFGNGVDKLVRRIAEELPTEDILEFEKSVSKKYSYLVAEKIDFIFIQYVLHIASIVSFYPVNYSVKGEKLFSLSIKSIKLASEYLYRNSKKEISINILDVFIKDIKKQKTKKKHKSKRKYIGSGYKIIDKGREWLGYNNYDTVTWVDKKYKPGGKYSFKMILAIGLAIIDVNRGVVKIKKVNNYMNIISNKWEMLNNHLINSDIPSFKTYENKEARRLEIEQISLHYLRDILSSSANTAATPLS